MLMAIFATLSGLAALGTIKIALYRRKLPSSNH